MPISKKQISAVSALPGPKRYSHFVKVAADRARVWGLFSDGWALAANAEGEKTFPVWPEAEYAALCAVGEWAGYVPKEIEVHDFLDELVPMLQESGVRVSVFVLPSDKGVTPTVDELVRDLRAELDLIE
jgi:hypothetical protein